MFIWQMRICASREDGQHDLNPGHRAFSEWEHEFRASAAYRHGDRLVGVDAVTGSLGSSAIVATVERRSADGDGERIALNPYFNQMADEPDGDEGYPTEYEQIEENAANWLDTMAGATEWRDWDWEVVE